MVVLAKVDRDPCFGQSRAVPCFGKEPPVVAMTGGGDLQHAGQGGRGDLHGLSLTLRGLEPLFDVLRQPGLVFVFQVPGQIRRKVGVPFGKDLVNQVRCQRVIGCGAHDVF